MLAPQLKNQHLIWRAGFGVGVDNIESVASASSKDLFTGLVNTAVKKPAYLNVTHDLIDDYMNAMGDAVAANKNGRGTDTGNKKEQQKEMRKQNREALKELNLAWLNEMATTDAPFREKMALFWHGHFACRNLNVYFQQLLLDQIRNNALGNFGDLLSGVSKSAAMLAFLNNQQNKKQHPNENFAREVMELFTLGRGNYTENDIKEAARAFTGWGFNLKGGFVFRKFQHDDGTKTIFGKKGSFDGDDVIKMLLEQKQTAYYITRKVYRYFVNDTVDENRVKLLAKRFFQSGYNIQSLMSDVFSSDWFYDEKNVGVKIKSPVELLVGMRKLLPMKLQNEEVQLLMERALGQILFYPPNVAGWPGGKNWIDSSTLMLRLRLPQLLKDNDAFNISPKADDDQAMGMAEGEAAIIKNNFKNKGDNKFRINADINWEVYIKRFAKVPREKLYKTLEATVLQTNTGSVSEAAVDKAADKSSRENYIKSVTIALMSTPEYQLC